MIILNKFRKRRKTIGLPPGTPVYTGELKEEKVRISVLDYSEDDYRESETVAPEECFKFKDTKNVTWINVDGIHKVDIIEKIGRQYEVHPLIIEDIVNPQQRPKMEDFGNNIYIVFKMLDYDDEGKEIKSEQVSLILGDTFVISFQEKQGDIFDPIRQRIRNAKGRIRKMGSDYLAYSLIDAIVDNYFIILEKVGERIEELENKIVSNPEPDVLQEIYKLKRSVIFLRKTVWPLRELISGLEKVETSIIREVIHKYLRDIYDHTIQIIDTVETYRDLLSGMHDTFLTSLSNRMNEVMKILTIIATIFIPLTFIAGIYGMNFKFMPELNWKWGYFSVWGIIILIVFGMFFFFKRKKWF
ncbi:magnesium/cobalt transporter CorA [Acidobacteriota bacterium]